MIIIGAGISGISAALKARNIGKSVLLLERQPVMGGYTRSIFLDDFVFDYTGHALHLAKHRSPSDLPYFGLRDDDWSLINRNAFCLIGNQLIEAPFQYNLYQLSPRLREICIRDFNTALENWDNSQQNLSEYLQGRFGKGIAELFLIPYNKKLFDRDLNDISVSAIKRFFPLPDPKMILRNANDNMQIGYNAKFWYPKNNGIQALFARLDLSNIHMLVNSEVTKLDTETRHIVVNSDKSYRYRKLISTLPLNRMGRLIGNSELEWMCKNLTHTNVFVFDFGIKGQLPSELMGVHWIYIPDESVPYYRVGVYSNFSNEMGAPNSYSLYVETAINARRKFRYESVTNLRLAVLKGLMERGWIRGNDMSAEIFHFLDPGYINFTKESDELVPQIMQRLKKSEVYCIGRYGSWDYLSMEDSIVLAMNTVEEIFL